jgi:hypothetical protein
VQEDTAFKKMGKKRRKEKLLSYVCTQYFFPRVEIISARKKVRISPQSKVS